MPLKRFIAGAVCQRCGQQDKVRSWEDPDANLMRRECVACGHEDVIAMKSDADEIPTRVNYTDPVFDEDVKPVRILLDDDPKSAH
jgi:Predicted nucleic-acid-binding protein containing a Zn-ribbon domain